MIWRSITLEHTKTTRRTQTHTHTGTHTGTHKSTGPLVTGRLPTALQVCSKCYITRNFGYACTSQHSQELSRPWEAVEVRLPTALQDQVLQVPCVGGAWPLLAREVRAARPCGRDPRAVDETVHNFLWSRGAVSRGRVFHSAPL